MFQIPEIRLAALTDPRFKLNWHPKEERDSNKQLLKQEYDQIKNENIDEHSKKYLFSIN